MKIFLAGATGVIGTELLPRLIDVGHEVSAMTRTPAKADLLARAGADPVVCDVYDRSELVALVSAIGPELVMHQLTDLPDDAAEMAASTAANARMRREGTDNLVAAARAAGATRFLAQSIAWEPRGESLIARDHLEAAVLGFGGVVVRYGQLYGPGTYYPDASAPPEPPRVSVSHAAARTVDLLDLSKAVVTVVDV